MVGKRVRDALYIHRSASGGLSTRHQAQLVQASDRLPDLDWTVARLEPRSTGLMIYEPFDQVAFPGLLEAWRVDLETDEVRGRSYRRSTNPLILHRKELLVDNTTPGWPVWAALTKQLVDRGLFVEPHLIGRRKAWEARLAKAGLRLEGHDLCPI